jgi:hypothetical protein
MVSRPSALVLVLLVAASTAARGHQQLDDSVMIAQRVLRAAYPELKGDVEIAMSSDTESDWRVANPIGVSVHVVDDPSNTRRRVVVSAHLRVAGGRLGDASFSGALVEQVDLRPLVAYARRQNDTPERVIEELKKAGLRFMSDDKAFLEAARLHRLEPVVGKIESITARFNAVPPIPTPVDYEHQPVWVVELRTRISKDSSDCYDVLVEPVNFRLLRISNELCPK